ncbi:hypothetical protein [Nonomuraea maritima]|uniref:hypothetical protein n=1 Tax=Nonomuraea maritima TaxID=683260 RepID=UPI003716C5EC
MPSEVEQWARDPAKEHGLELRYTRAADPEPADPGFELLALHLDGYSAVRLRDIQHATRSGWEGATPAHRAVALRGEHPQPLPHIDLDSTKGLIETLTRAFPLIGVHIEKIDPHVCHIGRAHGITRKKRLRLQEIGPAADWALTCFTSSTIDITRLDVGSGYIDALHAVGGDPPNR